MPVRIITGNIDSGKTSHLKRLSGDAGCWGILSVKVFSGNAHIGYDAALIGSPDTITLVREPEENDETDGWFRYRRFDFNGNAFTRCNAHLLAAFRTNTGNRRLGTCIVDEAGPLEMEGRGFFPALSRIIPAYDAAADLLYISVRPSLVEEVQGRFGFSAAEITALP